jgi:hypothetical protein
MQQRGRSLGTGTGTVTVPVPDIGARARAGAGAGAGAELIGMRGGGIASLDGARRRELEAALEEAARTARQKMDDMADRIAHLQRQLQASRKETSTITADANKSELLVKALQLQLANATVDHERAQADSLNQLARTKEQTEAANKKLRDAKDAETRLRAELEKAARDNKHLQSLLQAIKEENDRREEQFLQQLEVKEARHRLEQLKDTKDTEDATRKQQEELRALEGKLEETTAKWTSAEAKHREKEGLFVESLALSQAEKEEVEKAFQGLQEENKQLQDQFEEQRNLNKTLTAVISAQAKQIEDVEQEKQRLRQENTSLRQNIEQKIAQQAQEGRDAADKIKEIASLKQELLKNDQQLSALLLTGPSFDTSEGMKDSGGLGKHMDLLRLYEAQLRVLENAQPGTDATATEVADHIAAKVRAKQTIDRTKADIRKIITEVNQFTLLGDLRDILSAGTGGAGAGASAGADTGTDTDTDTDTDTGAGTGAGAGGTPGGATATTTEVSEPRTAASATKSDRVEGTDREGEVSQLQYAEVPDVYGTPQFVLFLNRTVYSGMTKTMGEAVSLLTKVASISRLGFVTLYLRNRRPANARYLFRSLDITDKRNLQEIGSKGRSDSETLSSAETETLQKLRRIHESPGLKEPETQADKSARHSAKWDAAQAFRAECLDFDLLEQHECGKGYHRVIYGYKVKAGSENKGKALIRNWRGVTDKQAQMKLDQMSEVTQTTKHLFTDTTMPVIMMHVNVAASPSRSVSGALKTAVRPITRWFGTSGTSTTLPAMDADRFEDKSHSDERRPFLNPSGSVKGVFVSTGSGFVAYDSLVQSAAKKEFETKVRIEGGAAGKLDWGRAVATEFHKGGLWDNIRQELRRQRRQLVYNPDIPPSIARIAVIEVLFVMATVSFGLMLHWYLHRIAYASDWFQEFLVQNGNAVVDMVTNTGDVWQALKNVFTGYRDVHEAPPHVHRDAAAIIKGLEAFVGLMGFFCMFVYAGYAHTARRKASKAREAVAGSSTAAHEQPSTVQRRYIQPFTTSAPPSQSWLGSRLPFAGLQKLLEAKEFPQADVVQALAASQFHTAKGLPLVLFADNNFIGRFRPDPGTLHNINDGESQRPTIAYWGGRRCTARASRPQITLPRELMKWKK